MVRRIRLAVAAGAVSMSIGILAPTFVVFAPAAGAVPVSTIDAPNDTVTEAIEDPIAAPRADVVAIAADSQPDAVTLSFRVAEPADPMADPNWLDGSTGGRWDLDVNGDGRRDYAVDYARDEETTQLTASLLRFTKGQLPGECDPKTAYGAETGYSVTVDPKCLGGATAFSYRLLLTYNTDVKNKDADVAVDVSPDTGWAGPVAVTLPPGVQPLAQWTPPQQPPAPAQAPSSPTAPQASTSRPDATTPTSARPGTSVTSAKPTTPAKPAAPGGTTAAPRPNPSTSPVPGLAQTGLTERAVRLAGFAIGIMLIGIGMLFGNRRPSLG